MREYPAVSQAPKPNLDCLKFVPGCPIAQAGTNGLHSGLFGGKAGSQTFGCVGLTDTIAQLLRGKNTSKEALSKAFYGGPDPGHFSYVNSCAYNHLRRYARVSYRSISDSKVSLIFLRQLRFPRL